MTAPSSCGCSLRPYTSRRQYDAEPRALTDLEIRRSTSLLSHRVSKSQYRVPPKIIPYEKYLTIPRYFLYPGAASERGCPVPHSLRQ